MNNNNIKDTNISSPKDFSQCNHDPENPTDSYPFKTCIEEKKHLLKTSHQRDKKYFGKHIPLLWRNNEPFLTLGPHWPLFLITWFGLCSVGVFIIVHISGKEAPGFKLATICVTVWQGAIYMLTALKNPGIITPKDTRDTGSSQKLIEQQTKFCKACNLFVSKDTRHCSDCKVCIKGFDHHCPWTGKCIGAGNWYFFYIFLFSTAFYIVFCMVAAGLNLK